MMVKCFRFLPKKEEAAQRYSRKKMFQRVLKN